MSRTISLVLFVGLILVSGNISTAKANDAAICYFHGVEHLAPPVPGREIRLESTMLKGDNTIGVSASLGNVLNGVLGGIAGSGGGCLFGFTTDDNNEALVIGATVVGAAVGGYLGSRSDSGYVTVGAIFATGVIMYALLVAIMMTAP